MAGYIEGCLCLPTALEGDEARNQGEVIGRDTLQGQV